MSAAKIPGLFLFVGSVGWPAIRKAIAYRGRLPGALWGLAVTGAIRPFPSGRARGYGRAIRNRAMFL